MKKNADGYLGAMTILVVVVIGLVGGTGYYVYGAKNSTDNKQNMVRNSGEHTPKKPTVEATTGNKQYEDDNLSLRYPETWVLSRNNSQPEWIYFTSKDYSSHDVGPSTVIQAGYLLEIRVSHTETNESFEQSLQNARASQSDSGVEIIQIDGHDSLLSNAGSGGVEGTFLVATAFVEGKTYYFRLSSAANAGTEASQVFKSLLITVRF